MKNFIGLLILILFVPSCVSMRKYKQLESEIKSKERQQIKLNQRLQVLNSEIQILQDSTQKLKP